MDSDLDRLARDYYLNGEDHPDIGLEERVQAWVAPRIAAMCRGRTLDMGWGTGLMGRSLAAAGVDLYVVEGSNLLATEARRVLPGRVMQTLFEGYSPGPIFDTVLCLHVLEHVEEPGAMLSRIRGWMKPGGRLVVVTPNAESIHRRVGRLLTGDPIYTLSDRDRLVGHRRVYDIDGLRGDIEDSWFQADAAFGWFAKPVNNARMLDWPMELIDALCELGWDGPVADAANIGVVARAV